MCEDKRKGEAGGTPDDHIAASVKNKYEKPMSREGRWLKCTGRSRVVAKEADGPEKGCCSV